MYDILSSDLPNMRDDTLKRVAVPRSIRTWMRRASREADAISGRSRTALEKSLRAIFKQELSTCFRSAIRDAAMGLALPLPGIRLDWASMASDREGPLGGRVASEISRRATMDRRLSPKDIVERSLEAATRSHLDGYVRELECQVRPDRDPVARRLLRQLRRDIEDVGLRKFAAATLRDDGPGSARPEQPALSLDENLLVEGRHSQGVQP